MSELTGLELSLIYIFLFDALLFLFLIAVVIYKCVGFFRRGRKCNDYL